MKTCGGSGVIAPVFLTSALDESESSALRPSRFTPTEMAPGTLWIKGRVCPTAGLDKNLAPNGKGTPGRPICDPDNNK
jgi:hypothetical protein